MSTSSVRPCGTRPIHPLQRGRAPLLHGCQAHLQQHAQHGCPQPAYRCESQASRWPKRRSTKAHASRHPSHSSRSAASWPQLRRKKERRALWESGLHPNFWLLTILYIYPLYWYVHGIHIRQVPTHKPKRYFCAVARSVTGAIRNACAIDPES